MLTSSQIRKLHPTVAARRIQRAHSPRLENSSECATPAVDSRFSRVRTGLGAHGQHTALGVVTFSVWGDVNGLRRKHHNGTIKTSYSSTSTQTHDARGEARAAQPLHGYVTPPALPPSTRLCSTHRA